VYEHSPGVAATYAAIAASPAHDTDPAPAGSPGSNVKRIGWAMTVAHTGPIEAVTDTERHESPPARKSTGTVTNAH